MRLLILAASFWALVAAKPETYKEKEDFQFSRSSSDDGTKSGYYGAQRGNMGGNYERAHNMDSLAQHQLSTLVKQVDGELGEGANTRTGSAFTAANSRGIYGSGNYDLSNLKGRNFAEGTNYYDSQSQSSMARNSGFSDFGHLYSTDNIARYSGSQAQSSARSSGYQTGSHHQTSQYQQTDEQKAADSTYTVDNYEHDSQVDNKYKYNAQSGSLAQASYDHSNINTGSGYDYKTHALYATPVRVYIRPGTRVAIPVSAQAYDASSSSRQSQNAISSDAEVLTNSGQGLSYQPTNNAKRYESSYSYRKEWEKHNTIPSTLSSTDSLPKNSELYEDTQLSQAGSNLYESDLNSGNSQSRNTNSAYSSGYSANTKTASSSQSRHQAQTYDSGSSTSNAYALNAYNREAAANLIGSHTSDATATSENVYKDAKPKSYQSSFSYHKSWERRGDPYIITPVGDVSKLKPHTIPSTFTSTENPLAKNSELYEDGQSTQTASNLYGSDLSSANSQSRNTNSAYLSGYSANTKTASSSQSRHQAQRYNSGASALNTYALNSNNREAAANSHISDATANSENIYEDAKPKSYQSSFSYHKSWERRGDPYVITPVGGDASKQVSQRLTAASANQYSSHQYDCKYCIENRKKRSINTNEYQHGQHIYDGQGELGQLSENRWESLGPIGQHMQKNGDQMQNFGQETHYKWDDSGNLGQQTQDKWDNLENLGQQTQTQWDNLQELGQQTQNQWGSLDDLGQQIQNQDKLEDLGQQTQNEWNKIQDLGQQTQGKLEDLGQQTQNQWSKIETLSQQPQTQDKLEELGQHTQTQWGKLEDLGQQTQNQWNQFEDLGQQTQNQWGKLEDLGQQTQSQWNNLEDLGQQTQNHWDNIGQQTQGKLEELGQQTQNQWNQLEDLGQQTQNQWDNLGDLTHTIPQSHWGIPKGQQTQMQDKLEDLRRQWDDLQQQWSKLDSLDQHEKILGQQSQSENRETFQQETKFSENSYGEFQSWNTNRIYPYFKNTWEIPDLANNSAKNKTDSTETTQNNISVNIHKNLSEKPQRNTTENSNNCQINEKERKLETPHEINTTEEVRPNPHSTADIDTKHLIDIGRGDIGPEDTSNESTSYDEKTNYKTPKEIESVSLTKEISQQNEREIFEEPLNMSVTGLNLQNKPINKKNQKDELSTIVESVTTLTTKPKNSFYNNMNIISNVQDSTSNLPKSEKMPVSVEQQVKNEIDTLKEPNLGQQLENVEQQNWAQELQNFVEQQTGQQIFEDQNSNQYLEPFEVQNMGQHLEPIGKELEYTGKKNVVALEDFKKQINTEKNSNMENFKEEIETKDQNDVDISIPIEPSTEKPGFWRSVWKKTKDAKNSVVSWFHR